MTILFVFMLASGTAFAAPVEIRTLDDLMNISDSDANLSLDYILMNDMDVGSQETGALSFKPIGTEANPFTGTFDGGGYTISNITFSDNTMDNVGLFGRAGVQYPLIDYENFPYDVVLKNVVLKDVNITGKDGVGGLLGHGFYVLIEDCSIENSRSSSIISGETWVGGLTGFMFQCHISDSHAVCNVAGTNNVGGLAGTTGFSNISKSYSTGDVIGTGERIGGLVGFLGGESLDHWRGRPATISDSYATGNVTGSGDYVGGLVGDMRFSDLFTSYATGNAIGKNNVGGLIGSVWGSHVSDNYATGSATGTDTVGGFVGSLGGDQSFVSNSYAAGTASGISNVGGFVGSMWDPTNVVPISNSFYVELGTPNLSGDTSRGSSATPTEMRSLSTFTNASWNISLSPTSNSIWYINEGISYPKFCWDYSTVTYYTVIFNSGNGISNQSKTVAGGNLVTPPQTPGKTGYTFVEWQYLNGTAYDFNTPVTSNLNLIAVYTAVPVTYTVIFDSDNGISNQFKTVVSGDLVTPPQTPGKPGYTFVEWQYLNGTAYDFNTPVTSHLNLIAVYQ